ncbi:MAG: fasciclin domain-containing protein [Candidatus Promineifilaceae bacterium]|nr:fasciclin domain-containing protein [Candidatus Promineifilaceae bacterium]
MKSFYKVLLLVLVMLVAVVPLASAAEDAGEEPTIVDIAINDGRFDTLVAAVVAADLVDTLSGGAFTAFAPTDDAFAKLGLDADNIASEFTQEELAEILLYHVLPEVVSTEKAKAMLGDVTMANGQLAGLKYFDGDIWVNDDSRVIIPDILAKNGVIHVVDTVILPPWPRVEGMEPALPDGTTAAGDGMMAGNSIVEIAMNNGQFDTLVAAVVAADLVDELSSGDWTVFAPTDDAFAKIGLNADNIGTELDQAALTNILLYHALTESVSVDKAKTMLGDVTMANGQIAGLKFFDKTIWVNDDSRVIVADVAADNGIIHVVDTVIQGPWPRVPAEEMMMGEMMSDEMSEESEDSME